MIYDYYCVDCGRKIHGNDIYFDLAQFLEMDLGKTEDRMALISAGQLKELAIRCGERLQEQVPVKLKVTLKEMLDIMAEFSRKRKYLQGSIETAHYDDLRDVLEKLFAGVSASQAMIGQMASVYARELSARFEFSNGTDREPTEEEVNDTNRYYAWFWIKPFFLENGASSELYTVQFRAAGREEKSPPVTLMDIVLNTEIRGYCPECGKPVLLHTGQVPHIMVGLLGAQSAGKTSLIVSMINHIQNHYYELGIEYPNNPLCDSKYRYMMRNLQLFEYGWAMEKTAADVSTETFNASLFLTPQIQGRQPAGLDIVPGSKVLTLIDIAGEACFDMSTQSWKKNAFEVYPLIRNCQIYLLCTCIDRKEYGSADGSQRFSIPPRAVLQIADQVYKSLPSTRIPPICIVATKADTMSAQPQSARPAGRDPFKEIRIDEKMLYRTQLEYMSNYYQDGTEDNREPLIGCYNAYKNLNNKTFIAMMPVSALGRKGQKYPYEGEITEYSPDGNFQPNQIGELTKWVLMTAGISRVEGTSYVFSHIPSFGESYVLNGETPKPDANPSKVVPIDEFAQRYGGIKKLYLNRVVPLDQKISDFRQEKESIINNPGKKIAKAVQSWDKNHSL